MRNDRHAMHLDDGSQASTTNNRSMLWGHTEHTRSSMQCATCMCRKKKTGSSKGMRNSKDASREPEWLHSHQVLLHSRDSELHYPSKFFRATDGKELSLVHSEFQQWQRDLHMLPEEQDERERESKPLLLRGVTEGRLCYTQPAIPPMPLLDETTAPEGR